MTIVAHVPNLFDRSRFGGHVEFVETGEEAQLAEPTLIIVDLDRCDDPAAYVLEGVSTIGFGPHVDSDLHQAALDYGYDDVLVRSVFFRRLPDLLASC